MLYHLDLVRTWFSSMIIFDVFVDISCLQLVPYGMSYCISIVIFPDAGFIAAFITCCCQGPPQTRLKPILFS